MRLRLTFAVLALWIALFSASPGRLSTRGQEAHKSVVRQGVVAFIDVNVVPMDGERILPRQTVIVRDGRIAEIRPADKVQVPKEARRIDGRGKYLMPGLIDMHVHIRNVGDFLLYLANGVTTVRNMRGYAYHLRWRDHISRGEMLGPNLYTSSNLIDGAPPFSEGSLVVQSADGAERVVTALKREGYDFIKVYVKLDKTAYDGIIEAARRHHIKVVGHVPWDVGMEHALASRQASIEHAENIYQTWFHSKIDASGIPAMAKATRDAGVWVCPTLTVFKSVLLNVQAAPMLDELLKRPELKYIEPSVRDAWKSDTARFAGDEPNRLRLVERFEREFDFFKQITKGLHDAQVPILAGTDTPSDFRLPGRQLLEELQLYCEIGFSPYEALTAATRNASLFLDERGDFGIVAVGKRADLILVDENPLQNIGNAARRTGVMVRGQWLPESELSAALEQLAGMYEHSSWQKTGYPEGGYEQLQVDIERMLEQMAHKVGT